MACDQGSKSEDYNGKGICRAMSCGCHSYIAGGHRFTSLSFGVGGERSCRFSRPSRLARADEVKSEAPGVHHATRRRGCVATCRTCAADQEIHDRLFQRRCRFDGAVAPTGGRTANTEPLPGSLATVLSPPIMRASLCVMASPRPAPPKR